MATINRVVLDEEKRYEIGNGVKCSVYLDLAILSQKENLINKKYKITYVSNSPLL